MEEYPSPDAGAPMRMPGLEREEELRALDSGLGEQDPKHCWRCGHSHVRSPKFFPNEWARKAAVFSHPTMLPAVSHLLHGKSREQLDAGDTRDPFEEFAELYNDPEFKPTRVRFNGDVHTLLVDPNVEEPCSADTRNGDRKHVDKQGLSSDIAGLLQQIRPENGFDKCV